MTEFMDGSGFNKGSPQSAQADRRDEAYHGRWLGFQAAASRAQLFWSMVESNVVGLRQQAPRRLLNWVIRTGSSPPRARSRTSTFHSRGL